ncbi:MAG: dihydrolipoyl dehydrogenase [Deltaproteobacteria bacterium]|jgi:dihydrolipoamide dehydrogenase|nr:dihydrolipoyl dehydrogenase [Deltaproteobacteria bacterium]
MSETQYDLIVIGSGPGGYVGAIRAAQLGLKTAVVEKDKNFGGTCLNVGCIPSKALLESSEHYQAALHEFKSHGVEISKVDLNLSQMLSRKDKVVQQNTEGIAFLFKKNKITPYKGYGKITQPGTVQVTASDGTSTVLTAKNIMIATGSVPSELPFLKYDEENIVSNTGALTLKQVPATLVVVGGGVIGLELGSVWARLGSKVTIIEYTDRLGGTTDAECMQVLKKNLQKEGIQFLMSTKVFAAEKTSKGIDIEYESLTDGKKNKISTEVVLVATGRKPFTQGLGCEELGIQKDPQGRISVDSHYQTNIKGIHAIGDVIHGPMLAHKAEEEGVALAELLAGKAGHVNYNTVPGVIYTHPEIATVGISEEQAKKEGLTVNIGKFPFLANGRARAKGFTEGFVKIIADQKTDKVLGAAIVGPSASEIIHEIVVCMEFGGSSEDLARSFHAHPTLSEVIREAALAVDRRQRQM